MILFASPLVLIKTNQVSHDQKKTIITTMAFLAFRRQMFNPGKTFPPIFHQSECFLTVILCFFSVFLSLFTVETTDYKTPYIKGITSYLHNYEWIF